MNISLILPTRGRAQQTESCLKSFFIHSEHPEQVEAWLSLDYDDPELGDYLNRIPSFQSSCIVGKRVGYAHLFHMMIQGVAASTGTIVFIINDDAVMETDGWDTKILAAFEPSPYAVASLRLRGRPPVHEWNQYRFAFPLVTREFWNTVLPALDPLEDYRFLTDRVFDACANITRLEVCPEVYVTHEQNQQPDVMRGQYLDDVQLPERDYVGHWNRIGKNMATLVQAKLSAKHN